MFEQQSRSRGIKHPYLLAFVAMTGVFSAIVLLGPPEKPYKKLDYSRPVYTSDLAIVCPQSIFFDPRADHGPGAILHAFMAITDREESAKALGCEIWQGGIPVHAHRMDPPFDIYAGISLNGRPRAELFTIEGNLTNSPTGNSDDPVPTQPQPPQDAEGSGDVIQRAYEKDKENFQRVFPSLHAPASNLRWYPHVDPHLKPGEVMTQLVTPYGPCALLESVDNAYTVMVDDFYAPLPSGYPKVFGQFAGENEAAQASERYCSRWYQQTRDNPHDSIRDKQLWFTPDSEPTEVAPPTADPGTEVPAPSSDSALPANTPNIPTQ